ncbi:hypothetical protein [Thermomonospora catenispora]|uniref:hypothetical protein n=1 Tax=Thermomonospora catenispora TaxID=2493090 RepID=UPI001122C68F|nr:hypothetical protein [Thermomonospora catenispora]TNY37930.1 hypothetical protein EIO00_04945 [Thermomonospora catenispora]
MLHRRDRLAVLGAGLLLALTTACTGSDDGDRPAAEESGTAAAHSPAPGSTEAPAGWRRHQGRGYTLALPPGWQIVDPTAHGAPSVRRAFGLEGGEFPELVEEALKELAGDGAVFAIETATVQTDYANHLQAGCAPGGLIGNDLETLRRKARTINKGSENLQITDVTVGDKPGIRISHVRTASNGAAHDTVEIQVPGPGDQVCEIEINTASGRPAADREQILATFRLT